MLSPKINIISIEVLKERKKMEHVDPVYNFTLYKISSIFKMSSFGTDDAHDCIWDPSVIFKTLFDDSLKLSLFLDIHNCLLITKKR